MAKQKKKLSSDKVTKNAKPNKKDTPSESPLAPPTQPVPGKRRVGDLSLFIRREQSISPATVQQKFSLQHYMKSTSIQMLVLQCPNLKTAIDKISSKISLDRNIIYSTVEKFFHGGNSLLWTNKYFPTNLRDSLHAQVAQKIKTWLKLFYCYKNTLFQESNSFIDDYFSENSNHELKLIKQYGWKLRGLIIKGRPGVGKSVAIMATAKDLQYEIFNCGNQCNQIKYLKQKNEATQSESVKTKMSKNPPQQQQKLTKTQQAKKLKKQQPQTETQSKRIQFMHNINNFFPKEDEQKFYNELNRTIQSSKIPFLMTVIGEDVPGDLLVYDVIQFQQASTQSIAVLLYLIYHVEVGFSKFVDLGAVVEREKFREVLNSSLRDFQIEILSPLADFVKLTDLLNKKLDWLFTFVQNCSRMSQPIDICLAEKQLKQYLKRADKWTLMNDYFDAKGELSRQEETSKQSIEQHLDITKYLLQQDKQNEKKSDDEMNQQAQDKKAPYTSQTTTPSKQQHAKTIITSLQRTVTTKNYETDLQQDNHFCHKQSNSIRKLTQQLQMKVIQDYKSSIQKDQCFIFSKLYNTSSDQLLPELGQNISTETHRAIRKQILSNVKGQYYQQNQVVSSLRASQLPYLGLLIDSRQRISRNRTNNSDLNLRKLLKNNEINYFKGCTSFLKPNSMSEPRPI